MPAPTADKAALRRSILSRRDALSAAQRAQASAEITRHLLDSAYSGKASSATVRAVAP